MSRFHTEEGGPLEEIERLVDLVARANVVEVTVRAQGRRITVRKTAPSPTWSSGHLAGAPAAGGAPPTGPGARSDGVSSAERAALPADGQAPPKRHWITAPMVGIFHPAEPPVVPGTRVESGQVVGVIESMKLMNDIRAEEDGIVSETAVEAGMPVEYGQPLYALTD